MRARTSPCSGRPRARLAWAALPGLLLALWAVLPAVADDGTWKVYLNGNEVAGLAARGEEIWAATSGGVVRLAQDGTLTQWNRAPLGLLSDSVGTVAVDAAGAVWVGTDQAGISVHDPTTDRWRPLDQVSFPIPSNQVARVRFFGPASAETLLVSSPMGYTVLVQEDYRGGCTRGVDPCDMTSFDIRDALLWRGEIWLATATGITVQKVDGTWSDRSTGIGQPGARSMSLLARGDSLYAGSAAGLWTWNGSRWSPTAGFSALFARGFRLRDLLASGDTLYAAGVGDTLGQAQRGGVWRRVGRTWSRLGGDFPRDCSAVARTASGRLFAGGVDGGDRRNGIWELSGGSWIQHRLAGPSLRAHYLGSAVDGQGALWLVSAQKGSAPLLSRFYDGSWSFYEANVAGRPGSWGVDLLSYGGDLWVAHCCCAAPEDACSLERVRPAEPEFGTLPVNNAWDLSGDDNGHLWIATDHDNSHSTFAHGLARFRLSDSTWIKVNQETALGRIASDQVKAVRTQGRLVWVGYQQSGVSRFDLGEDGEPLTSDDHWRLFVSSDSSSSLIGNNVKCIEVASDGRVWVGTTAGISIWDGSKFYNVSSGFGHLPAAEVNALLLTSDGGAWVATKEGGLTLMTRRAAGGYNYTSYGPPDLPNPNIETMTYGPDGRVLWLGTDRGLASFRPPGGTVVSEGVLGVYPNPLSLSCLEQGKDDGVRLSGTGGAVRGVIVDLSGQIVARFPAGGSGRQDPSELIWDGRRHGSLVAPGLYWIRVQTPRGVRSIGLAVIDAACSP